MAGCTLLKLHLWAVKWASVGHPCHPNGCKALCFWRLWFEHAIEEQVENQAAKKSKKLLAQMFSLYKLFLAYARSGSVTRKVLMTQIWL